MGTYYRIVYIGQEKIKLPEIDSLLKELNSSINTYDPLSTISFINQHPNKDLKDLKTDKFFIEVFTQAKSVFKLTEGSFDPSIMPLVNYWGFGFDEQKIEASSPEKVASLLALTGFDEFSLTESLITFTVEKKNAKSSIDFSAIAKGSAVDKLGEYLQEKGIMNYLVDIGGELIAKGKNDKDEFWRTGIEKPIAGSTKQSVKAIIPLKNQAIASSGNYRNYRKVDNKIVGHTLNPQTGYPEVNSTLGVSVIADECWKADAFATAFMVMGWERALEIVEQEKDIEAYFIYGEADKIQTKASSGLKDLVEFK